MLGEYWPLLFLFEASQWNEWVGNVECRELELDVLNQFDFSFGRDPHRYITTLLQFYYEALSTDIVNKLIGYLFSSSPLSSPSYANESLDNHK